MTLSTHYPGNPLRMDYINAITRLYMRAFGIEESA